MKKLFFIFLVSLNFISCEAQKSDKEEVFTLNNTYWELENYSVNSDQKKIITSTFYTLKFSSKFGDIEVKTDCIKQKNNFIASGNTINFVNNFTKDLNCTLTSNKEYDEQNNAIIGAFNTLKSYKHTDDTLSLYSNQNIILTFHIIDQSKKEYFGDLKPFKSDGCSLFPDGTLEQQNLWLKCCQTHDYEYWMGGTYEQREDSDKKLQTCVEGVGEKEIAFFMLLGVRVGGSPLFDTPFRWGYGWPYPKGYSELSKEELQAIEDINKEQELNKRLGL